MFSIFIAFEHRIRAVIMDGFCALGFDAKIYYARIVAEFLRDIPDDILDKARIVEGEFGNEFFIWALEQREDRRARRLLGARD